MTLLLGLGLGAAACKRDNAEDLPAVTPFALDVPYYFPALDVPPENPLSVEGIALGRRLYYDPLLSANGPQAGRSCSNCHEQELSFSDINAGTSVLPHVNLAWNKNFLWDGRVQGDLEDIMRFEVEEFFAVDVQLLRDHPDYPGLFAKVFGSGPITAEMVAKALAQWFRRLTSTNSRFDQYLRYEATLTSEELGGMMVYLSEQGDCFHCHGLPLLSDNAFHNIGLDSVFSGADQGRYLISGDPADLGKFKAPTLRNVALTAPYMHDGRLATLEEVVEHYNSGVRTSPSLDPLMTKPGQETTLNLTATQKAELIAFLNTFTDETFVNDPALGSPF